MRVRVVTDYIKRSGRTDAEVIRFTETESEGWARARVWLPHVPGQRDVAFEMYADDKGLVELRLLEDGAEQLPLYRGQVVERTETSLAVQEPTRFKELPVRQDNRKEDTVEAVTPQTS